MKNLIYILALILVVLWAIGFFTHVAGFAIHLMLVAALVLILISVIIDDMNSSHKSNHIN